MQVPLERRRLFDQTSTAMYRDMHRMMDAYFMLATIITGLLARIQKVFQLIPTVEVDFCPVHAYRAKSAVCRRPEANVLDVTVATPSPT